MSSIRTAALAACFLLLAPVATAAPQATFSRAVLTFYWVIDESAPRYRTGSDTVLRDCRGRAIAQTTTRFRRALVCEGAGRLRDGRLVVYEKCLRGEHRFRVAAKPVAVTGCGLVPFRTVAVDPRLIKLGSKIYIPQLKGTRLPDGTIHDGVFIAADRGRFRGRHIDVFVGCGPQSARPFVQRGYGSRSHVMVYLLKPSAPAAPS